MNQLNENDPTRKYAQVKSMWRLAIVAMPLCLAVGTTRGAETGRESYLSDDGEVVTVAKIPNALRLADFANHLGLLPHGTRVLAFETKRDPAIPVTWTRIQILEGEYRGKTGWVISPTVHEGTRRSEGAISPSDQNTQQATRDRSGRIRGNSSPTNAPLEQRSEADRKPVHATHHVVHESWIFSAPNIYGGSRQRVAAGDLVERLDGRDDGLVSFRWMKVRVKSGTHLGRTGWLPSHTLRPIEKRIIFSIWYRKGELRAFERAATTQLDEISHHFARTLTSNSERQGRPPIQLVRLSYGIRTKHEFLRAWKRVAEESKAKNAKIHYGCLVTESSIQDDNRDGLEFAAPEGIDATLRPEEILAMDVLPWHDDAHGLYLNGCYSGAYEGWIAERTWCPASLFCKRQQIITWGQVGTSTFSSNPQQHVTINATSPKVYLYSFDRRKNNPLGDGRRIDHREFRPEQFTPRRATP